MYSHGEIILIPVPFSNLSSSKKRPGLVISNDNYNKASSDLIVVAITSNLVQPGIPLSNSDMVQGQLPKSSIIRYDKIYSLDKNIIVKSIGKVSGSIINSVRTGIISLIS